MIAQACWLNLIKLKCLTSGVTSASKEMNTTRDDDSISNASTSSNSSRKVAVTCYV